MPKSKENANETHEVRSKSQRRRDALEVKELARELIAMNPSQLAGLPLDGVLRKAIEEARSIRSRVARKRQLQFVAKLLRRVETAPITEAILAAEHEARQLHARHHRLEAWRDHLVANGDPAVGELVQSRQGVDVQAIRQLVRQARLQAERNKPPAAARALFRLLRDMDETEALPPIAENGR